jgi:hypothetical protein
MQEDDVAKVLPTEIHTFSLGAKRLLPVSIIH